MKTWFDKLNSEYRVSRREMLKLASLGVLAPSISGWFPGLVAHAQEQARASGRRPKACILLWMAGGPSQVHTFNLPTAGDYRQYEGMQTAVPGIRISEHLPKIAEKMRDFAIVRSMATGINDHGGGTYLMHMGFRSSLAIDYPSMGSIVARELRRPENVLPGYVCIGAGQVPTRNSRSGFLGADHAPLMIAERQGIQNIRSAIPGRAEERANLLQEVEAGVADRFQADIFRAHQTSYRQALELMRSDQTRAFDLTSEPSRLKDAYGTGFGQQCLLARRLVEAGVSFVEVTWGGHGGIAWDSHGGGAEPVRRKSPELDSAMSTLVQDLRDKGLLDSTLVIWMGEFGRGPRPGLGGGISGSIGGGHYARAWTTVLAGAGLRTGQVIGRTDAQCVDVEERPVPAIDFFATVCRALGIDPHKEIGAPGGRPHYITPRHSQPIAQLFA